MLSLFVIWTICFEIFCYVYWTRITVNGSIKLQDAFQEIVGCRCERLQDTVNVSHSLTYL